MLLAAKKKEMYVCKTGGNEEMYVGNVCTVKFALNEVPEPCARPHKLLSKAADCVPLV